MWFLIRGVFWFSLVLIALPFFDGEAQKKLEGAPQVEAVDAISAAAGAISYISQICGERPDVCEKGAETAAALGSRAREGALVAYKILDKKFADGAHDAKAGVDGATTASLPDTAAQPLPETPHVAEARQPADALVTGGIVPIPQARPRG